MSALQLQAYELMGKLSDSKLQLVIEIMKNFSQTSEDKVASEETKRIGIAKGEFVVPDDIDDCNDEIAAMFGVNE